MTIARLGTANGVKFRVRTTARALLCSARMLRESCFAVALGLLACACNHVLARNNPCGGTYPVDGYASIGSVPTDGVAVITTTGDASYPFDSDPTVIPDEQCDTFVAGTASDDGTQTIDYEVSCGIPTIAITLPDVRTLEQGARVAVAAKVTTSNGAITCLAGQAAFTIEVATGGKAPSPAFVTADFVRAGTIDFDGSALSVDDGGASDASALPPGCPSRARLHAHVRVAASNYSQATGANRDVCPSLPEK